MNTLRLIPCFAIIYCSVTKHALGLPLFPIQFPLLSAPPPPLRAPVFSPSASFGAPLISSPIVEEFYPLNVLHSYVPSKDLTSVLTDEPLDGYYHQEPKKQPQKQRQRGHGYRQGPRFPYGPDEDDDDPRYYGPPAPYGEDEDDGPYGPPPHGGRQNYGGGSRGGSHGGRKYHGPPRGHRNRYVQDSPHQYGPMRDNFGAGPDGGRSKAQDYVLPRDRHREFYGPPSDGHPRAYSHSHQLKHQYPNLPPLQSPTAPHGVHGAAPCPSPPCDSNDSGSKVESLSIPLSPQQLPPDAIKPGQILETPRVTHFIETARQQ